MEKVRPWCGQPLGQRTAKEQNRILSSVTLETPPPPPPEELSFTNSQILERRWGYPPCSSLKKKTILCFVHYTHNSICSLALRMRIRVYETFCVRLSVCPCMGPQHRTRCCRFAAVGPAGMRYRSIAAAAVGECGQCHVISVRTGS